MVGRPHKHLAILEPPVRQLCAYAVLALFVVFIFYDGLSYHYDRNSLVGMTQTKLPDFSNDQDFWTLSAEEFPLDDPTRRVVIVGDVHGMYGSLQKLLQKISYDPSSDVLVHVGDFLTKAPHTGSMETLSFMASHNITGVRGNHDQQVIEWRAWIHWIRTQPGGPHWLDETHVKWINAKSEGVQDPEEWLDSQKHKDEDDKWWKKIPKGWVLFGTHFTIAQDMSEAQFAYLRSLPYTIHIPNAHAFIVHGGLLASNPEHGHEHSSQPLARIPRLPKSLKGCNECNNNTRNTLALRAIQERAILTQVPQNTIPYNILNIRSIVKGKVTKQSNGKPWSKAWKEDMLRCAGFDGELKNVQAVKKKKQLLPCYPITVVYGHAAGRGLDVKRWSVGLDTGCVYERHLSALVLGGPGAKLVEKDDSDDEEEEGHVDSNENDNSTYSLKAAAGLIKFGSSHHGKIVRVRCP